MSQSNRVDFLIIGAGIVGLAVARELRRRYCDLQIKVLEKEPVPGCHSSGRNSGVLHSGIYYPPGTLKARVCSEGARELSQYCEDHHLPISRLGKLLIPLNPEDASQLDLLEFRAREQGITVQRIDSAMLNVMEPDVRSATGEALLVSSTAVVKPKLILSQLAQELRALDVDICCGGELQQVNPGAKQVTWNDMKLSYGHLINCAGAYADVVAHQFGAGLRYTLLPFRGSYWKLDPGSGIHIHHLIYPVPDLRVPFLGVHSTTSVDGDIYLGPTATPALGRESYSGFRGSSLKEMVRIIGLLAGQYIAGRDGFRHLAWQELTRTTRFGFAKTARILLPKLKVEHLLPAPYKTGIRAQVVDLITGRLVTDFLVEQSYGATHVINAISPAFTSSFSLARHLVEEFID